MDSEDDRAGLRFAASLQAGPGAAPEDRIEQRRRFRAPAATPGVRPILGASLAVFGDTALLKGGLVLEIRLERARATKDVDLRLIGSPESVLKNLQEAGRLDLMDFMTFEIAPDTEHPQIQNEGMRYEGLRFRAESRLAGKLYGQPFGVDVAFGDPILGEPETVTAEDTLAFAGVAPPTLRIYPIETHVAEKLHAYTLPRQRTNTRVKDLPDIALLGTVQSLDAERLRMAFAQTFEFRGTHAVPSSVPDPPASWSTPYRELARENELAWATLEELTVAVGAFLNPVLIGKNGTWRPMEWQWS